MLITIYIYDVCLSAKIRILKQITTGRKDYAQLYQMFV